MDKLDQNTLLIATSGYAKSKFLQAIKDARHKNYDAAETNYKEGALNLDEAMKLNHAITQEYKNPTLLMVHAHNYLMNALLMKDLAFEMIEFIKKCAVISVVIVCAVGMSSSLLLNKIKEYIKTHDEDIFVSAMTYVEVEKFKGEYDILLLAPQISHLYDYFLEKYQDEDIVIDIIDLKDLGRLDAENVVQKIKKINERKD